MTDTKLLEMLYKNYPLMRGEIYGHDRRLILFPHSISIKGNAIYNLAKLINYPVGDHKSYMLYGVKRYRRFIKSLHKYIKANPHMIDFALL